MVGLFATIEVVAGIKCCPLPIPPTAAVKAVGALLQHHVHDRAAVVSKLGGKAVVLDLKLLHDFDRGLIVDVRVATLALFRRTERTPIEGDLGCGVTLTVGNKVSAGRIAEIGTRGLRHPAREKDQRKRVAAVKRSVFDVLVRDVRAKSGTLSV